MSVAALAFGGWISAALAAGAALLGWRLLAMRRECVARACHEVRGALTAARLGIELGERRGELPPARLRGIELELGRAALALEDLTRLRVGAGVQADAAAHVDVGALVADSVSAWSACASVQGKRLRVGSGGAAAFVAGTRYRLAQALGNLIANAIEHGGEEIVVSWVVADARVRIGVLDDGAGLTAPVAELIGRTRRSASARGRGLAIAASVAGDHGGRLAAAPTTRGARLVLELPAAGELPGQPVAG